jgi:hypothetical protein
VPNYNDETIVDALAGMQHRRLRPPGDPAGIRLGDRQDVSLEQNDLGDLPRNLNGFLDCSASRRERLRQRLVDVLSDEPGSLVEEPKGGLIPRCLERHVPNRNGSFAAALCGPGGTRVER